MCCIWGAIRATGWRVGAAGLRARHVWRRGLRGTKTTRMIVLVQIVARYSASAVTHQPHMHCAGGAAVSCAHSPVQRHTMVAAHVLKAPLSPTWKTELLPATLSVALLPKCLNLPASQSRVDRESTADASGPTTCEQWRDERGDLADLFQRIEVSLKLAGEHMR